MTNLDALPTPSLLLDRDRMLANIERMSARIAALGCKLRPHVKTHKSRDVLDDVKRLSGNTGITVSTLQEARYFFAAGHCDILYAVGMTPQKVGEAARLINDGCALSVITDNLAMARLLDHAAGAEGTVLPVLIEIDVDGHRAGVDPHSDDLLELASFLDSAPHLELRGVMTHAGASYDCGSLDEIRVHALRERELTLAAATRIREQGMACTVVSVGSSPTASVADNLDGITEIRPGVYTFNDLFQAGLGVARMEDIAISVLTTVIGHQVDKGWVIIDAGWMAMSRDHGTASQAVDQGYGVICQMDGSLLDHAIVGGLNQEHGIMMAREGMPPLDASQFPVGSKWRILPNHACATAAQYPAYQVIEGGEFTQEWPKTSGW